MLSRTQNSSNYRSRATTATVELQLKLHQQLSTVTAAVAFSCPWKKSSWCSLVVTLLLRWQVSSIVIVNVDFVVVVGVDVGVGVVVSLYRSVQWLCIDIPSGQHDATESLSSKEAGLVAAVCCYEGEGSGSSDEVQGQGEVGIWRSELNERSHVSFQREEEREEEKKKEEEEEEEEKDEEEEKEQENVDLE
uniref:Uncharacterized protein n=1 Tax=Vespula pensylvanica TaxID=30213 RepID=A0A834PCL7_VESPE|nr:hypothetical protein H0235_003852 [Vespula pensylvanica]